MFDVDLYQRLRFTEGDFLTALENGTKMLASYHQTWSTLPDDLPLASENGTTGKETLSLVHFVASRISNIASCYLDVKFEEESFASQLRNDCDAMLHQMNALTLNHDVRANSLDSDSTPCFLSTPTLNEEPSFPPFLSPAYRWLLDNLHSPYPTAGVKARIAAASSCQVSSVNSWFINARRRIGWTRLCRERFSNCRADMIDAAYRALVEEDLQRMLSPELRHAFITMKVEAEGLHSSTLTRSVFAGDLDANAMEGGGESLRVGKCPKVNQADLGKTVKDSYPSPDRSIAASPVPALDDSPTDESEEDISPPVIGCKRRRSSAEPVAQPVSVRRPVKCFRASMTSRSSLPSPRSSSGGTDVPSRSLPEPFPVHSPQSELNRVLPSRKRRLSNVDNSGVLREPRGSAVTPYLHSVSGALPHSDMENEYSLDDWFNTNFDVLFAIPPPVDASEPDFSASWEVELFKDYSIPGVPKCAPEFPPAPTTDTSMSAVTDLSDIDSLLQSIISDTLVTPSESTPLFNTPGTTYMPSFDSKTPDTPHIDWTSLCNGPVTYQSSIRPLPEIELSMLQLPHVMPAVNSQGDFASKQAKLHQLYAMQEEVRRMERELQSEGVII